MMRYIAGVGCATSIRLNDQSWPGRIAVQHDAAEQDHAAGDMHQQVAVARAQRFLAGRRNQMRNTEENAISSQNRNRVRKSPA